MTESTIEYRAIFDSDSIQKKWLLTVRSILSVKEMATLCGYTERTVRDWLNAKSSLPYECVSLLVKETNVTAPTIAKVAKYAHTSMAGKRGGRAVIKKYGRVPVDEEQRKIKWRHWWNEKGHAHIQVTKTKPVSLPAKNLQLAEFIGIMLGDGGLSKYQASITLHSVDEYEYGLYVRSLINKLFGIEPSVYYRKEIQAYSIVISRSKVVEYLCSLGLVIGNKVRQKANIPRWILDNQDFSLACLRGLMDTDGSVYIHKYQIHGKWYKYKKLCFSSACKELRDDVITILDRFGSRATCSGTNVRVDSVDDVKKYMELIGTHNPKHLIRYMK